MKILHIDKQIYELLEADKTDSSGRRSFLKTVAAASALAAAPTGTGKKLANVAKTMIGSAQSPLKGIYLAALKTAMNNPDWFDTNEEKPDWYDSKRNPGYRWGQFGMYRWHKTRRGKPYLQANDNDTQGYLYAYQNNKGEFETLHLNPINRWPDYSSLKDPVNPEQDQVIRKILNHLEKEKHPKYRSLYKNHILTIAIRAIDDNYLNLGGDFIESLARRNPDIFISQFKKYKDQIFDNEYKGWEPETVSTSSKSKTTADDNDSSAADVAKTAATDIAKTAATSGIRSQAIAGSIASFKKLIDLVLGKINVNPKTGEPTVKDMGKIEPTSSLPALPAPDRSAAELMRDLQNIVDRPLTDKEKEIVKQEIKKEKDD